MGVDLWHNLCFNRPMLKSRKISKKPLAKRVGRRLGQTIHQSYLVVVLALGIITGVVLGLTLRINYFASPVWLAVTSGLMVIAYLRPRLALIIVALIAGMIMAFFRISLELAGQDYIRQLHGQLVLVRGTIAGDPETDETTTKYKLNNLAFGEAEVPARGSLYITAGKNEDLARSDIVVLYGKLSEGFGTYAGYMYRPSQQIWRRPEPGDFVLGIRNFFAGQIRTMIPEPEVSLGLSYLLGMKAGLPDELSNSLRVVGLVHIVVASGAHLSILVEIARRIFGKLSRFAGLILSLIFILFFMAMVGWTPSILRAGIMTSLTLVAWYSGRKFSPARLILLVAAGTLMINPMFIIDLGWLLSFASFTGIMLVGPKLQQFLYGKQRRPGFIASTIITTVAATATTLPVVLYYYGQISLINVVANLLILPTLPIAMGLVFVTGVLAMVPGLGPLAGWLATKLLDYHIAVVGHFGQMEQFLVKISPYQPWVYGLYLIIIGPLLIGLLRRKMLKSKERNKIGVIKMSGHSKWATTKRQKAVVDAKRGALFTKIGNQIAIAARAGTDPAMNPSLAMVLDKARHANMPKANIERAIARAADKSAAALIEETYEAYGPGGVGIVIEVATDNKNRTLPEVRHTLDKNGGRMADAGSVMFQFARKGVIEISETGDEAVMAALEAGAEDATEEDAMTIIYTAASDLMKVRQALIDAGLTVTSAEMQYVPSSYVSVEGETAEKLEKLLTAVDDLDDVTNVYTNAE